MRAKVTRSPLGSTTVMFNAQPRLLASATAAWIAACARSIVIGVPYVVANGILSGTASKLGGAAGAAGCCWA